MSGLSETTDDVFCSERTIYISKSVPVGSRLAQQ